MLLVSANLFGCSFLTGATIASPLDALDGSDATDKLSSNDKDDEVLMALDAER